MPEPAPSPAPDSGVLLARMVAAVDRGDAQDAFLCAAAVAQATADRLQGSFPVLRVPQDAAFPVRAAMRTARRSLALAAGGTTVVRGRLGLGPWHVAIRDLTNVLAEAALLEDRDARARALAGLRGTVAGLRAGIPEQARRWLHDVPSDLPEAFYALDLHPADALVLAGRLARRYPQRNRVLLVLGLRTDGAYLAPLVAAALRSLDYSHVVCRTTRSPLLLPEEPRLIEGVRRLGGMVLLCGRTPRTGRELGAVAARLVAAGFAPGRVVPVYASWAQAPVAPPAPLRAFHCAVLSADQWRIRHQLAEAALRDALAELLPAGTTLVALSVGIPARRQDGHLAVDFEPLVRGPDGTERRISMMARGVGLGWLACDIPSPRGELYGVKEGVELAERKPTPVPRPRDSERLEPTSVQEDDIDE